MSTRPAKKGETASKTLDEKFEEWVSRFVKEQPQAAFFKIFGDGHVVVATPSGVALRARNRKDAHDWFDAVLKLEDGPSEIEPLSN